MPNTIASIAAALDVRDKLTADESALLIQSLLASGLRQPAYEPLINEILRKVGLETAAQAAFDRYRERAEKRLAELQVSDPDRAAYLRENAVAVVADLEAKIGRQRAWLAKLNQRCAVLTKERDALRERESAAVLAEREACAVVAEETETRPGAINLTDGIPSEIYVDIGRGSYDVEGGQCELARDVVAGVRERIAAVIRARGKAVPHG